MVNECIHLVIKRDFKTPASGTFTHVLAVCVAMAEDNTQKVQQTIDLQFPKIASTCNASGAGPSANSRPETPGLDGTSSQGGMIVGIRTMSKMETTENQSKSLATSGTPKLRHTMEEKRKMRHLRKKRIRQALASAKEADEDTLKEQLDLKEEQLKLETEKREKAESEAKKYRGMATTYFERFCWEVQQRRDIMHKEKQGALGKGPSPSVKTQFSLHEINEQNLQDPVVNGKQEVVYLGRGAFGIVKVQLYRDILVAVKEYLPRSLAADVKQEAALVSRLCHPYLPLLIGVCTTSAPLRLVMQFHGVDALKSLTIWKELQSHQLIHAGSGWLILTGQLMEALRYLHIEAECLHNDIKPDNILLTSTSLQPLSSSKAELPDFPYQIVLIDFGKGTTTKKTNYLRLAESEKPVYKQKRKHISPEVIDGIAPFSSKSDMYSVGHLMQKISGERRYFNLPDEVQTQLNGMIDRCLSPDYMLRPEANCLLQEIRTLVI